MTKRFGGLTANQDISFSVEKGDVIGLIGPNGAGKSTLFNCISCFYRASAGRILFRGEEITNDTPEAACRKGIGRTFQIVRIFKEMSVLENIMIGAFLKYDKTKAAANRAEGGRGSFSASLQGSAEQAGSLTISEQKRLEVARAFATGPEILLLTRLWQGEYRRGAETTELMGRLKSLGMTLLLVEHVMEGIMPVADKVVVLDYGRKIAEGPPSEIVKDEKVIKAYLGVKYAERRARRPVV